MYLLHNTGRRMEGRGEVVQILPENVPSAWWSSEVDTQAIGQKDLYTYRYHSHVEIPSPLSVIVYS